MKKLLYPGFAAACLALAGSPAMAGEVTLRIDHSDLDLTRKADVETLRARAKRAIRQACANESSLSHYTVRDERACEREALAQAERQIDRNHGLALAMADMSSS
ncbi:hypothetical protein GCM10011371_26020 [Novosphingobium marinum]|uniref:UrcA family protein n=1 Tax=Novosphingobium marinum TaxID=1514948 RepID=A0A7Y9XX91_9SPHN|nr:UrcA family protein [Novosphingobium marinum]NYH94783.1 UrcA family protein [Novosphingobium marinum]GGC37360.1 hypothetical protein GCM10011371_26020 [Novosphingobium marinum]